MPVFFIDQEAVQSHTVTISGPLAHHLLKSLRVRIGQALQVATRQRHRFAIQVARLGQDSLEGIIVEELSGPPPNGPSLVLGQGLLKGEKMDWLVQKSTELGCASIVPLLSHHTVIRPQAARTAHQQHRLQRIALEAAQQAERWDIPDISTPITVDQFFSVTHVDALSLILVEREEGNSLTSVGLPTSPSEKIILAVGPEGGWTKEEVHQAREKGFLAVTLGTRILRAETAAITAITIVQSRLGELG